MKKSVILIATAGTLWGLLSLFFRYFTSVGLSALQSVAVRNGAAALLLIAFMLIRCPEKLQLKSPRHIWYFIGTGMISLAFFNFCYFVCIDLAGVSVAAMLLYTAPAFVMLFSAVLFAERLTMQKMLALFLTVIGCGCVTGAFSGALTLTPLALLSGLGAGIGYALYSIFGTYALRHYDSTTITAYTVLFATIGVLPVCKPVALFYLLSTPGTLIMALASGLLCTVLPYLLYTKGLSGVEAGQASILATVEPVVAVLVGILIFHEPLTIHKVLGILLILGSIVLLNLRISKRD